MKCHTALLGATLLVAAAGTARAQRPHRSGLWGEIGWGPGAVRIGCAGCPDVRFTSGNASLARIGGTISNKVLLGVETFGVLNEGFGFTPGDTSILAENATLSGVVLWFPWRGGMFLKGAVGLSGGTFTVTDSLNQQLRTESVGVGLSFGLGFDRPISRKFALTANLAANITAIGDVIVNGQVVDDVIATAYMLSIGVTFR